MELDFVPARLEGDPMLGSDKMPYTETEERAILQGTRLSLDTTGHHSPSPASGQLAHQATLPTSSLHPRGEVNLPPTVPLMGGITSAIDDIPCPEKKRTIASATTEHNAADRTAPESSKERHNDLSFKAAQSTPPPVQSAPAKFPSKRTASPPGSPPGKRSVPSRGWAPPTDGHGGSSPLQIGAGSAGAGADELGLERRSEQEKICAGGQACAFEGERRARELQQPARGEDRDPRIFSASSSPIADRRRRGPATAKGAAASKTRSRGRWTRWDQADPSQIGAHLRSGAGLTVHRPGAVSWRRDPSSMGMGSGSGLCRDGDARLGGAVLSSVDAAGQRSPSISADTADFNPWPLSSPTLSSVGSESSTRGAFSPPRELGDYYVASYVLLLALAPITRDMISTRVNLQRFLQILRLAAEATGFRLIIRRCRHWRQPSRRHGRHEGPRMELPGRGQGPWQP
jgi:hypothetical protein